MTRTSTANGFFSAEPLQTSFLQHPQELDLRSRGHVADFIQKDGSMIRLFESPDPPGFGPGECATFVAKELAFEQRFRNGRAVDGDKRALSARSLCW